MDIFILTSTVTFLGAFMPFILKPVFSFLFTESKQERKLQNEILLIKKEMSNISVVDEFAKHARFQRKMNKAQEELRIRANARLSSSLKLKVAGIYAARMLMGLLLLILTWGWRYTPVIVLPERWLHPLPGIFSWPTHVVGAVSITVWIAVAGTVAKMAAAACKI